MTEERLESIKQSLDCFVDTIDQYEMDNITEQQLENGCMASIVRIVGLFWMEFGEEKGDKGLLDFFVKHFNR